MSISEERGRLAEDVKLTHQKQVELAQTLTNKGYSNAAIASIMRISENTVRILVSKPKLGEELMLDIQELHWVTGVQYARTQPDVSYEEWCDLYYDHLDPTLEQIQKACETALPILHRNKVIDPSITEFHGMTDGPDAWPRRDDPNLSMRRSDIGEIVKQRNLANNQSGRFRIEGPWSFKGLDGYETSLYIFLPGGARQDIGKVTARIDRGLMFDIDLQVEHRHVESAGFEVPMRFNLRQKKSE